MSRILHADLDAFYASVEQRDDPRLQGKPIIVGGGVVLAASYEAKAFGIRTAMNGRQARQLCPHAIEVPPRMEAYSEASKAVFEIFDDTSPLVEGLSIDEAFIDVTGLARISGDDLEIGQRLRERVAAEVGLAISVGGGSTKFLAKVASAVCKPNGLLVVAPGGELDFLHPLPVGRLWGVGPVTTQKLGDLGIHTVSQVAELDRANLVALLGQAAGHHVHALANNLDPRSVEVGRRRRSIGSQQSFRAGSVDRAGAEQILLDVVDRVARRLRAGRRVGRTIVIRLRYDDFRQATRSRTMPEATATTNEILSVAKSLLSEAWTTIEERGLTKLGVAITGLDPDDQVQLTLPFSKGDRVQLDGAIDDVRERFGNASLVRTTLVHHDSREVPLLPD